MVTGGWVGVHEKLSWVTLGSNNGSTSLSCLLEPSDFQSTVLTVSLISTVLRPSVVVVCVLWLNGAS